jgi:LacI family transcriptional regulator
MREVAEAAGVSPSTVGNVLNNPAVVAPETRRRVERAMTQVGFVRSGVARQLRGLPSRMVGVVTLDAGNPFYAEVNRGIEDRLAEDGCMALVSSNDARPARELQALSAMEEHDVRGIIVAPVGDRLDRLADISGRGTPVVLLDHPRGPLDVCAVAVDNAHAGALVAEHLIGLGHERAALVWPSTDVRPVSDRRDGVHRAFAAAGLAPERALTEVAVAPLGNIEAAEAAVDAILADPRRPTAVVCFNDLAALGVMRGLERRGVAIPGELSLAGFDDLQFSGLLSPKLTTVSHPKYGMGRHCAELLLAEADPGHRHREILLRPSLVVRESTAPPGPASGT